MSETSDPSTVDDQLELVTKAFTAFSNAIIALIDKYESRITDLEVEIAKWRTGQMRDEESPIDPFPGLLVWVDQTIPEGQINLNPKTYDERKMRWLRGW